MGLKDFIPFFQDEESIEAKKPKTPTERRTELNTLKNRLKTYELIINRYRVMIEKNESKTVADLKSLIKPKDETIVRIHEEITKDMRPYLFDEHFREAAKFAHKFVKEMRTIRPPIDFWLEPKELIGLRGGDPMDKAIFLCTLLVSLENSDSFVIVGVNTGTKVAVSYKLGDKWTFVDPISKASETGDKEELLQKWFGDSMRVYEFNDRMYNQLVEQED